jgi:hypothetical protein
MKQLPQNAMMSKLLKKKKVGEKEIIEIARILADFHSKANTGKGISEYGSMDQIRANWAQNFEQTKNLRGNIVKESFFDFMESNVFKFIEREKNLFEARVKGSRIRECHGDLHSGNIFIIKPKIYIFDAIEFNKAFSCSDVAAEVAFLAMDLEFNKREDLSSLFVQKYIEHSGDKELLKLLPFYKCYRAYVRAKVSSFKLGDPNISKDEKREAKNLAKRYFDLAYDYSKELYQPSFLL